MDETRYGLGVKVPLAYETAIERVTEVLKTEGFGVLTTIDMRETLKKKLGVVGDNPELQAVATEADAGLRRVLTALERAGTIG